jgi:hypothetical protein
LDPSGQTLSGRRWRQALAVVGVAGVALAACSLLVPLDEQQCTVRADCTARGAAFESAACVDHVCVVASGSEGGAHDGGPSPDADPWGCLDQPSEVTDPGAQVAVTFTVFDALAPITTAGPLGGTDFTVLACSPVSGISFKACDALDPPCAKPVTPVVVTDDAGQASFSVPETFTGFYQFSGPGYLSARVYTGQLLAGAPSFAAPCALLGTQETSLLANAIGVTMSLDPDGGLGHIFFQSYDCFDRHAPGVTFSIAVDAGPQTVQWYAKNQLPSTTARETDSLGAGGAVNVPAGAVNVTATLASTKRTLGAVNTVVSAGATTFAWVRVRTH